MNKLSKQVLAAWIAGILFLSLGGCSQRQTEPRPSEETIPSTSGTSALLPSNMQTPSGVQTVLLMSLTDFEIPSGAKGLRNEFKADLLLLMTMDANGGTTTAVQIDPDVMVSFKPQGASEAESLPLGIVYTYGSGGSDSNINILTAVAKLLDDQKIDHYLTFEADSIRIVSELLGGITVDVTEPLRDGPPELAEGGSVTLDGECADFFFNYVSPDEPDNMPHMNRQQEFMKGAYSAFAEKTSQEDFAAQLTIKLGEKMRTDLTLSQMLNMLETLQENELDQSIRFIGKDEYAQ